MHRAQAAVGLAALTTISTLVMFGLNCCRTTELVPWQDDLETQVSLKDHCYTSCIQDPLSMAPPTFRSDIVNPCWTELLSVAVRSYNKSCLPIVKRQVLLSAWVAARKAMNEGKTTRLRCLPSFYLIGMPKCGTTDLYMNLLRHVNIAEPYQKETHWLGKLAFSRRQAGLLNPGAPAQRTCVSFDQYLDNFDTPSREIAKHPSTTITLDASTSTLWFAPFMLGPDGEALNPGAVFTHSLNPNAKAIVMLRNPIDRLYSDFTYFNLQAVDETAARFHVRVEDGIQKFRNCTGLHSREMCVAGNVKAKDRLNVGFYSVYLRIWLRTFRRSQLHVIITERYRLSRDLHLDHVFDFLGLPPLRTETSRSRRVKERYNVQPHKQPMLNSTYRALWHFYRPEVLELAALLQDKRLVETWKFRDTDEPS